MKIHPKFHAALRPPYGTKLICGDKSSIWPIICRFAAKLLQICTLIAALLICKGCSSNAEKPAPPPPGVTVTSAIQKDVSIRQEWVGTMSGNVDADIRPKVDGFLLSRLYTEGSYITEGRANVPA